MTTGAHLIKLLSGFATESAIEEVARLIPLAGLVTASGMSFAATYCALKYCLKGVEETVLLVLEEATQNAIPS